MENAPAIRIAHVSKRFPGAQHPSVDDVSVEVQHGQFVVLLGPSGCGKTTLLKMINRLYEPTSGTIFVNGTDIMDQPVTTLRRQIGYVIQQTGLFPHMRIEDNIAVVPKLLNWDTARIDRRINELLDLIGLPHTYRRRYPRQLSGGEQQRVGIARALAADPGLMLMDEPFGAIDAITRVRLQDELLSIQRKLHKTIMFVTHDVEEALRLADKIMVMREGRVVQFDTPLHILTQPADEFVAQLVNANDVLRQLSLITTGSIARRSDRPLPTTNLPQISGEADLRAALALMIQSAADTLSVVNAAGQIVGTLTFDQIQHATHGPVGEQSITAA